MQVTLLSLVQYQRFREQARMARRAAIAPRNMHPLALLFQTRPEQEEQESVSSKVRLAPAAPVLEGVVGQSRGKAVATP